MRGTLCLNGYPKQFSPNAHLPGKKVSRKRTQKLTHQSHTFKGVSKAVAKILSSLDVKVQMKPMNTLRNILSHPKDRAPDADNMLGATTIRLTGQTSASLMLSPTAAQGWPGKRSTYASNPSHSTGIRAVCQTSTKWPHNDPHPIH